MVIFLVKQFAKIATFVIGNVCYVLRDFCLRKPIFAKLIKLSLVYVHLKFKSASHKNISKICMMETRKFV